MRHDSSAYDSYCHKRTLCVERGQKAARDTCHGGTGQDELDEETGSDAAEDDADDRLREGMREERGGERERPEKQERGAGETQRADKEEWK